MKISIQALAFVVLTPLHASAQRYIPSTSNPSGEEVVAVFVTQATCIGSKQPHMPNTIERMKVGLARQAAQRHEGLSVVGVSLDWAAQEGVDHLAKFGAFDEIIVGRNWYGTGATRFIWRDLPGQPSTPQILLLRHSITTTPRGIVISKESEIRRIIGADEIKKWVDSGAPVGVN
jgi:hypothetical protein